MIRVLERFSRTYNDLFFSMLPLVISAPCVQAQEQVANNQDSCRAFQLQGVEFFLCSQRADSGQNAY